MASEVLEEKHQKPRFIPISFPFTSSVNRYNLPAGPYVTFRILTRSSVKSSSALLWFRLLITGRHRLPLDSPPTNSVQVPQKTLIRFDARHCTKIKRLAFANLFKALSFHFNYQATGSVTKPVAVAHFSTRSISFCTRSIFAAASW